MCTTRRKRPYIIVNINLINKMPIAMKINPQGFLNLICIAVAGLNHLIQFFPPNCYSRLVHHFIPSGNVESKSVFACINHGELI